MIISVKAGGDAARGRRTKFISALRKVSGKEAAVSNSRANFRWNRSRGRVRGLRRASYRVADYRPLVRRGTWTDWFSYFVEHPAVPLRNIIAFINSTWWAAAWVRS
jgi:hypothetical protein